MAAAKTQKSVDLGVLQDNLTLATKNYKTASTVLKRAKEQFLKTSEEYMVAKNTLAAGVEQVQAMTHIG